MDIGILVPATVETQDITGIAQRIEGLGFESLWIPEHPVIPVGFKTEVPGGGTLPEHYNRWADPFIALTMAAAATTTLKLATGICLFPEREPLITAKVIATLDLYSGGRTIIGVGAGWLREETEVMGTNFRLRWRRLRETTEALRICWTEKEPSYQGEMVQFPPVFCDPKPVQKAGPPIFLGGHVPKALERVARTYDGWCPLAFDPEDYKTKVASIRTMAKEFGRDPDALQMSAFIDPKDGTLSADEMKAYRDAGASRIVLFSQPFARAIATGQVTACIDKVAPVVEAAQGV
jgi:probable F420-dependent oxidoreductase